MFYWLAQLGCTLVSRGPSIDDQCSIQDLHNNETLVTCQSLGLDNRQSMSRNGQLIRRGHVGNTPEHGMFHPEPPDPAVQAVHLDSVPPTCLADILSTRQVHDMRGGSRDRNIDRKTARQQHLINTSGARLPISSVSSDFLRSQPHRNPTTVQPWSGRARISGRS